MYGETPTCAPEDGEAEPPSNYGKFKAEAEDIVAAANVQSITLRLANVYGPRQRRDLEGGVVAIFLARWRNAEPLIVFGDGTAQRDYIHVDDVAQAVVSSFAGKWSGTYNIGSGVATSVNDLIAALTDVLGPPAGITHAPERPAELQRSCLDASKAQRDGLWRLATPLAEGLRRTASVA
jgi:UDP-glucose 4-epimerase